MLGANSFTCVVVLLLRQMILGVVGVHRVTQIDVCAIVLVGMRSPGLFAVGRDRGEQEESKKSCPIIQVDLRLS